jgi:hypothetical protein
MYLFQARLHRIEKHRNGQEARLATMYFLIHFQSPLMRIRGAIQALLLWANDRYLNESSCLIVILITKTNFPFDKGMWLPFGKLMMTSGGMLPANRT